MSVLKAEKRGLNLVRMFLILDVLVGVIFMYLRLLVMRVSMLMSILMSVVMLDNSSEILV